MSILSGPTEYAPQVDSRASPAQSGHTGSDKNGAQSSSISPFSIHAHTVASPAAPINKFIRHSRLRSNSLGAASPKIGVGGSGGSGDPRSSHTVAPGFVRKFPQRIRTGSLDLGVGGSVSTRSGTAVPGPRPPPRPATKHTLGVVKNSDGQERRRTLPSNAEVLRRSPRVVGGQASNRLPLPKPPSSRRSRVSAPGSRNAPSPGNRFRLFPPGSTPNGAGANNATNQYSPLRTGAKAPHPPAGRVPTSNRPRRPPSRSVDSIEASRPHPPQRRHV